MTDSTYTVKMTQSGNATQLFVPRLDRTERFDVQVVAHWNEASRSAGCGLQLGVSCEAQYALAFSAIGLATVSLIKVSGNKVTETQTLTKAKLMPRDLRNSRDTLTAKVRGRKIAFFVNDQRITQIIATMILEKCSVIVFAHGHENVSLTSSRIRMQ